MPDNWDGSSLTAKFIWTHAGTSDKTVQWGILSSAANNGDTIFPLYGTVVVVNDTSLTAGNVHITNETGSFTPSGNPSAGSYVIFEVSRENSGNLTEDAKLLAVRILYGINNYEYQSLLSI
jgi:hypothetical protein